jgi:type I restriction enzyme R subunit
VREKGKVYLNEIIAKINELFEGELTDDDKLVYVNNVLKGELLESAKLRQQAGSNTKEQFANSPDLPAGKVCAGRAAAPQTGAKNPGGLRRDRQSAYPRTSGATRD